MKKQFRILLLLLATLSSQAQSGVYSSNIVGYATVTVRPGYSLLGNPLTTGVTNGANEIGLQIDGEQILIWDPTIASFDYVSFDQGLGGWINANLQPASPPALPPGKGFFFYNPLPTDTNITFIGQVIPSPGTTNCMGVPPGFFLFSSPLPANVPDISAPPVNLPILDGMQVLTWDSAGSKYVFSSYDSTLGGWIDINLSPIMPTTYSIGQGFFLFNPFAQVVVWCQSLP
jgi:hypothetical protein